MVSTGVHVHHGPVQFSVGPSPTACMLPTYTSAVSDRNPGDLVVPPKGKAGGSPALAPWAHLLEFPRRLLVLTVDFYVRADMQRGSCSTGARRHFIQTTGAFGLPSRFRPKIYTASADIATERPRLRRLCHGDQCASRLVRPIGECELALAVCSAKAVPHSARVGGQMQ